MPDGGTVSDNAWDGFLREVVTPAFPQGFSVFRGHGQWRTHEGTILREETLVLEFVHAPSSTTNAAIETIRKAYRERFHQESVLHVRTQGDAEF